VLNRSARLERDRRRRSGEQGRDRAWPRWKRWTGIRSDTTGMSALCQSRPNAVQQKIATQSPRSAYL